MTARVGSSRPGGRTSRTRDAVHAAVRALRSEDVPVTIAEVAAKSGVHPATIYRRWRTVDALLVDVEVDAVAERSPVPATGDIRKDMTAYARRLVESLRRPQGLDFFRALSSTSVRDDPEALVFLERRIAQFERMLVASGTTELTGYDIFELVLAPAYTWAMLAALPPGHELADRLTANVLAVRDGRRLSNGVRHGTGLEHEAVSGEA